MRFTDAETCCFGHLIDSDHRAVKCCLRLAPYLRKKRSKRTRLMRLDYNHLLKPGINKSFADNVVSMLGNCDPTNTSFTQLTTTLNPTQKKCFPDE
jgi:hypothetical protein